ILGQQVDRRIWKSSDEQTTKGADRQSQHIMFISGIQSVERPERIVPALVGFGRREDVHCHFKVRTLWFSPLTGFEFIGGIKNGEIGVPRRSRVSVYGHAPEDVEGRAQIMNGIGCDGAPAQRW